MKSRLFIENTTIFAKLAVGQGGGCSVMSGNRLHGLMREGRQKPVLYSTLCRAFLWPQRETLHLGGDGG